MEEWWGIRVERIAMFRLSTKLDKVRRNVQPWKKTHFGDIFKTKKEVEVKLEELQKAIGEGFFSKDMILEEENGKRV